MRSGTSPTLGPPSLRLRDLLRAAGFCDHHQHIWVEIVDRVVVLHTVDPSRHRQCRSAHVGQFDATYPADDFLEAVNIAIERAWRG
jgi:hypothetical protein